MLSNSKPLLAMLIQSGHRNANLWVRIRRRYPGKTIRQVVIYLRRSKSALVHQTRFEEGNTSHGFEVIGLWEQPFEAFLQSPGLLPFALPALWCLAC